MLAPPVEIAAAADSDPLAKKIRNLSKKVRASFEIFASVEI